MNKDIILTSLRSPFLDDAKVYPPLGILKLEAIIKKEMPMVRVNVVDSYDDIDFATFSYHDLIGLSVMTPQREEALKLLHGIKARWPDKKVIIGGPHAKHYFDDVVKEDWDFIVPYDGERSILKIIRGEAERIDKDFMDKKTFAAVPPIDRIRHKEFLSTYHYELQGVQATSMLTATGCPERCTFCEDAMTAVRWNGLDNITYELDQIVELGYGGVYIFDDIFAIAQPKVKPIAEEIGKRGLIYRCNGQARYMNEGFMQMLAETGCKEIAFGAETGSQTILDNINKRTTVEMNYKFIELCKLNGIDCKAFILLGLPGETYQTLGETEEFIEWGMKNGLSDFQACVYMPYKGTQIRDAIEKGKSLNGVDIDLEIVGNPDGAYGIKGGETSYEVRTAALSADDLQKFRNHLVETYRPKSHAPKWQDKFHDTHLASEVEYK